MNRETTPGIEADTDSLLTRFASRIHLAPEGLSIAGLLLALGLGLVILGFYIGAVLFVIIGVAIGAFFRDPERLTRADEGAMISAADGRVCGINQAMLAGSPGPCTRISVFMSPLDVHVNRAPVAGEVTCLEHTHGKFGAAFRDIASEHNERNLIRIRDRAGTEFAVVQIAGYLARRIVCRLKPHQRLERGQRIGLIMFGSRVDHFLPHGYRVQVQVGDKVRAGETILGEPPR